MGRVWILPEVQRGQRALGIPVRRKNLCDHCLALTHDRQSLHSVEEKKKKVFLLQLSKYCLDHLICLMLIKVVKEMNVWTS